MTIEIWLLSLALAFSAGGDGGRGSPEAIQSVARVGADGFRDENTIHARTEPDHLAVGIAIEQRIRRFRVDHHHRHRLLAFRHVRGRSISSPFCCRRADRAEVMRAETARLTSRPRRFLSAV